MTNLGNERTRQHEEAVNGTNIASREQLRERKIDAYVLAYGGERSREEVELCVETANRLGISEAGLLHNLDLCNALQPNRRKIHGATQEPAESWLPIEIQTLPDNHDRTYAETMPFSGAAANTENEAPLHLYASSLDAGIVTDARIDSGGMGLVGDVSGKAPSVNIDPVGADILPQGAAQRTFNIGETEAAESESSESETAEKVIGYPDTEEIPPDESAWPPKSGDKRPFMTPSARVVEYPTPPEGKQSEKFLKSVELVKKSEGDYTEGKGDAGGATKKGISTNLFDEVRNKKELNLKAKTVEDLTDAEILRIYKIEFWDKLKAERLPSSVAYMLMDIAVNNGVEDATEKLQIVLNTLYKAERLQEKEREKQSGVTLEAESKDLKPDAVVKDSKTPKTAAQILQERWEKGEEKLVKEDGDMGERTLLAVQWADPEELLRELYLIRLRSQMNVYVDFVEHVDKKMDDTIAKLENGKEVKARLEADRKRMSAEDFERRKQALTKQYALEIVGRDKKGWEAMKNRAIAEVMSEGKTKSDTDQMVHGLGLIENRFPTSLQNALNILESERAVTPEK